MFEDRNDYFACYIEDDIVGKAQFLWVSLFYFMAKVCIDEYDVQGESVIRQAVRSLGMERALRKRQRSDAQGLEPNLVSMSKVPDLYEEPRFDFGKQISHAEPEEKIIKVYTCPNSNIWARLEGKRPGDYLRIGSIYCEEVHHYLYGKYDPAIQVNLCEILTKGDDLCNFRLNMRRANRKQFVQPPYKAESWEDPDVSENSHRICLKGDGVEMEIRVKSFSTGGVTGKYTPVSACGSLCRILETQRPMQTV